MTRLALALGMPKAPALVVASTQASLVLIFFHRLTSRSANPAKR